jgi:uncharacterized protein YjbI with pentapeptide repeats
MPIYSFFHRWTRDLVAMVDAPTFSRALEFAVREGMCLVDLDLKRAVLRSAFLARADLRGAALTSADLCGCYLRGADLRAADLRGTRLAHAFLGRADLSKADLRGAVLTRTDLRGANLLGVDLRGTVLTGARLNGALCDWHWSAVPVELLRQHPDTARKDMRLIMEMAFCSDLSPWSWLEILSRHRERAGWALGILADSVRDGDNAPALLRCLTTGADMEQDHLSSPLAPSFGTASSVGPVRAGDRALDPHLHALAAEPASSRVLWVRRRTQELAAQTARPG